MSWDVFVFNLSKTVKTVEEIDEDILVNIGTSAQFSEIIKSRFPNAVLEDRWCKIENDDYCLEAYVGDSEKTLSNTVFHLYGETAIYALVELCKSNNWQAFDTSLGCMLNLEKPGTNGYLNHLAYVKQIMEN